MPFIPVNSMLKISSPDPIGVDQAKLQSQGMRSRNALADQEVQRGQRLNALMDSPGATPDDYSRVGRSDIGNALLSSQRQRTELDAGRAEAMTRLGDIARQTLALDPADRRAAISRVAQSSAYAPVFQGLGVDARDWSADGIEDRQLEGELKRLATLGKQDFGPLEQIVGADGNPQFVPRGQAVGKQPYRQDSMPTSLREAQAAGVDVKNPAAVRSWFDSRKGRGISMTMPDGTQLNIGGEAGEIGPGELTAPSKSRLQEAIIGASDDLDRLNSVGDGFDPKFLTVQGRAMGASLRVKDLAGGLLGEMTPREQDYLNRYSSFRADASRNLTMTLKRLSGAAITPSEGERVGKGLPTDEDSPTQFQAKYKSAVKDLTRGIMRANWALKNGIGVKSVEDLSRSMPLSSIDAVYEQRANELWRQMGGTPETRARALQQANQEFGLARGEQ